MAGAGESVLFKAALASHQAGRLDEAKAGYREILKLNPKNPDALHHLGIVFLQTGNFKAAADWIERSLAHTPRQPVALANLAFALVKLGHYRKAVHACNKALQLQPGSVASLVNRANAYLGLGEFASAEQDYLAALAADPDNAEYVFNLANALFEHGAYERAAATFERALSLAPGMVEIPMNLGAAYMKLRRPEDALAQFDRVLATHPDSARAWSNRGNALNQMQKREDALASYRKAVELDPDLAETWSSLGITLRDLGRLDEAEASCRRVLELDPGHAIAQGNLGSVLRDLGRLDEALDSFEKALARDPGYVDAHRNILLSLTYHPAVDPEKFFAAHRRFEAKHARPLYKGAVRHANTRDPARRLKIGYLSADLRGHSVATSLLPLVRGHDRARFDVRFYAEVDAPDATTLAFQSVADGWRSTVGLDDRAVADMIQADGIDILVCLAGRFDRNRPLVAALRPTPVQISLYDAATSGMEAMDYLISDRTMTPRGTVERFTERLLCVPYLYLSEIPDGLPPVRPRPPGPVVFGSLNNPSKVGDRVLDLWARTLAQVPESRLVLRDRNLYEVPSLRARVTAAFERGGVDAARVDFPASAASFAEHMEQYNAIDVALDTFPFAGSTTTFDALVMGVPVVTLQGWNMMSRWTAAMLRGVGLDEFVAATPEEYIEIAARIAGDAARRAELRATLRARLSASTLCDGPRKTRQLERFYRAAWKKWCAAGA
jgi:protein O-GlcNAc transferase